MSRYHYHIGIYRGVDRPEKLMRYLPRVFTDWLLCDSVCKAITGSLQKHHRRRIAWPDPFVARPTSPEGPVVAVHIASPEVHTSYYWDGIIFTGKGEKLIRWDRGHGLLEASQESVAVHGYIWFPVAGVRKT